VQLVLSQQPADGCPAGYTTLAAPFSDYPEVPDACYRKIGLDLTLSAAETAALTAITTKAFDSRDQMAVSTAGKTWGVFMAGAPSPTGSSESWCRARIRLSSSSAS